MKKIVGVSLLSAVLIFSCQKKEESQTTQTQQESVKEVITQPQQQIQQPESQPAEPQQLSQQPESQPAPKPDQQQVSKEKTAEPVKTASIDGKSIFTSKGCVACHQENADAVGPSLKKIAAAYNSDKAKLTAFLKGEGKAIVDPTKEAIMKPQIEVTKKLSKEELDALADFILKH